MNNNGKPVRVQVSGIPVDCLSWAEVLQIVGARIDAGRGGGYISITNTESMYHALRDSRHFEYVTKSDLSLCDGIGSVIGGYAWGHDIPRRNGPILVLKCCEYGTSRGWRHFFYGGKEGVANRMAKNLEDMYPGMVTAGTYCPPFRELTEAEKNDIRAAIRASRPDIVWVGLGLIKQERWVAENIGSINCPWIVGVGGAFDYHSGELSWAPRWLQAIGMEWLYRLVLQPKTRFWRYVWSFEFMFEALWGGLKQRLARFRVKKNPHGTTRDVGD